MGSDHLIAELFHAQFPGSLQRVREQLGRSPTIQARVWNPACHELEICRRVLRSSLQGPKRRHLDTMGEPNVHVSDLVSQRKRTLGEGLGIGELASQHRLNAPEHQCVGHEVRVSDASGQRLVRVDLAVGALAVTCPE